MSERDDLGSPTERYLATLRSMNPSERMSRHIDEVERELATRPADATEPAAASTDASEAQNAAQEREERFAEAIRRAWDALLGRTESRLRMSHPEGVGVMNPGRCGWHDLERVWNDDEQRWMCPHYSQAAEVADAVRGIWPNWDREDEARAIPESEERENRFWAKHYWGNGSRTEATS